MSTIGVNFKKKISAIMKAEKLSMPKFSKEVDVPYNRIHHYVTKIKSNPSIENVGKVIHRFPQYTGYILEIDIKSLPTQKKLKD